MKTLGIVLDLDGVLINSLEEIFQAVNQLRANHHLDPLAESDISQAARKGVEGMLKIVMADVLSFWKFEDLVRQYQRLTYDRTKQQKNKATLYPNVETTLRQLRTFDEVALGVCTSKVTEAAEEILRETIKNFRFDAVMGPDKASQKKPAKEHLLELLSEMQCAPANAWYIGDSPVDQELAINAGVTFMGAAYGYGGVEVEGKARLDDFGDLMTLLPLPNSLPKYGT